ncbi:MAG: TonB-dependent receptor [Saprospiraceae bacterium]|nr:TonB-dependent receptor [Saprospiraceae bacterium]
MSKTKLFFTICLCFLFKTINAQVTQTVRGRVLDATTQKPLVEASVVLDNDGAKTTSNTEGAFRLEKIAVGRHILKVGFVGFETVIVPDILLESGKEIVLDISLKPLIINTDTLVVKAQRETYFDALNGIRNEKLSRYPATFNDPARLITYLPGAATDNDGTNNISVRGSTPNAIQWYLEGAEIVNPNHLTNAGTPSDQATVNGGGVLIPGFNVMGATNFYKGAMSADMGGALTSVMDIRLRKGNDERRETQASIGLIGVELGTEGRFSKSSKASYLVHYRYSTLGLLSKMGVDLGDEENEFQDLTINLNFPTKKAGTFSLFGIYGTSSNIFTHLPKTEWKVDKDSQDIKFTNQMGALGLRHELNIGLKGKLSTVAAYSALTNTRTAVGFGLNDVVVRSQSIENSPSKLFLKSVYSHFINAKNTLKVGIMARSDEFTSSKIVKISGGGSGNTVTQSSWWLQPSVEWQSKFGKKWTTNLGARMVQWIDLKFASKNETTLEPVANIEYQLSKNAQFNLGFSTQTQMVSPLVKNSAFDTYPLSSIENITKSHNLNLAYQTRLFHNVLARVEAYYQYIFDASTLSINTFEIANKVSYATTGRNAGVEIDIQQRLVKGFYWRANATIYDAKYKLGSTWADARFNGQYITNVLIGKEWMFGAAKNKFLGVNVHTILRGGFIDVYSNQRLKDYLRSDLNVYWKVSHKRYASTVQLDLQNVTNQQNEGWRYYDYRQGRVLTKYQLGLLPNLAYKIEF